MYLREVLNNSYPFFIQPAHRKSFRASFELEDGGTIYFGADLMYEESGEWEVAFGRSPMGKSGRTQAKFDVSGEGDQFRIFATILEIMRKFIAQKKPYVILFSAKESSRAKLYEMMIKRYSKQLGYNFKGKDRFNNYVLERL